MPLIILKPVCRNTRGFTQPDGEKPSGDSFPSRNGFGFEEWNNSPAMACTHDGLKYRAFHTEPVSGVAAHEHSGDVLILMHSALDQKSRQLVGIAGRAIYLAGETHAKYRRELAKRLPVVKEGWKDCWRLRSVQAAFDNDERAFREFWRQHAEFMPHWLAPRDHFLWLSRPVDLPARELIGKGQFQQRFDAHQFIAGDVAKAILSRISAEDSGPVLSRLRRYVTDTPSPPRAALRAQSDASRPRLASEVASDIAEISSRTELSPTEKLRLIEARLGQGKFRKDVLALWDGRCAVTMSGQGEVIRASHIVPWRTAASREKRDPNNGLPLTANLDALFDRGLISFTDAGEMLVSPSVSKEERRQFRIPRPLCKQLDRKQKAYLARHRSLHKAYSW